MPCAGLAMTSVSHGHVSVAETFPAGIASTVLLTGMVGVWPALIELGVVSGATAIVSPDLSPSRDASLAAVSPG